MRPLFQWDVGSRRIELGKRTLVMGVLNLTPDSFSGDGRFATAEAAVNEGLRLLAEGADLLDVGGESTRPGVRVGSDAEVTTEEECRRVLPVLQGLRTAHPEVLISVDTYKAETARAAVAAGAEIVNDVSGLRWDPRMAKTVGELGCGVVLMHTRGTPQDWRDLPFEPRIVNIVEQELHESVQQAIAAGVQHSRMVLDPGFGFGKSFENNYPLLGKFQELHSMGFPWLVGVSRKSFLGRAAGKRFGGDLAADQRLQPSIAAAVIAAMKGAHIVRVHDVRATVEALAVVDAVQADEADRNPWFDAYS